MLYFTLAALPYLMGASFIFVGLRLSPLLVVVGIALWATTWLLG